MKKLIAALVASLISTSAMALVSDEDRATHYFGSDNYYGLINPIPEFYFVIGEMAWWKLVDKPWEGCDWTHTMKTAQANGWFAIHLNNGELMIVVHDDESGRATLMACLPDNSISGQFMTDPEAHQQLYAARVALKEGENEKLFVSEWNFRWVPYVDASSLWTVPDEAQE